MKQKIVLKVQLNSDKCKYLFFPCQKSNLEEGKSRALKIAAVAKGVSNVSIDVEKEQMEVIGENVDSVELTKSLRKKLGFARIVSVEEVKKEEEKPKPVEVPIQCTSSYFHYPHYDVLGRW